MEFASSQLELGRLYFERGDILKAISSLEPLVDSCILNKNQSLYLDSLHLLFRCYAEHLDFDKIEIAKIKLLQLTQESEFVMNSKIYYVLALCASYNNDHKASLDYSQKALSAGLAEDNKEAVCYAISGLAISYYLLDQLQDSLKEIFNLQVFMDLLDIPQIRISAHILKGQILRKMGKYDQALDILSQSYDSLKKYKNFYMYLSILHGLALTYRDAGKIDEARTYLDMARRTVDPENLKKFYLNLEALGKTIEPKNTALFDIVFNSSNHVITERNRGRIDFNNQFILMDLLKLFLLSPGYSFSKEQLVKHIWKQSYNPAVHDNKIYVTIKRLRQLIEPNVERPRYIFRSKNGYYFNKDVSVQIEESVKKETI